MSNKTLWLVTGSQNDFLLNAQKIGANAVAIRTDNHWLAGSIGAFHNKNIKVYGWRWPGVKPTNDPVNYYAPDQAKYVAETLIPAGLDGYIADIESDGAAAPNRDWANRSLAPLAKQFAQTIVTAGQARNKNFLFGLTSGYDFPTAFPNIPWDAFLEYTNAVYPQMYWCGDGGAQQAGGTAQSAYNRSMASWKTLALNGKPIIPIIGQIEYVTPQSIADFASIMRAQNIPEVHFYTDVGGIQDSTYTAMGAC